MSYGNERDVEVHAVVEFVRRHVPKAARMSLLDVGAHGSHATYAPMLRKLVSGQRYAAIDKIHDPATEAIVDEWTTGDLIALPIRDRYDAVTCVSVIEHVGIKPWRSDTAKEERLLMFFSLLRIARSAVLLTAPFGHGAVTNEYACVTPDELATWSAIASLMGFSGSRVRFYLGEDPQGSQGWQEVPFVEASKRGVAGAPFVVMVMELVRP